MTVREIVFKDLPFQPEWEQVIYYENDYDDRMNGFIRSHYDELKVMFDQICMEFYYLPYLHKEQGIEEKVRYYAPYLTSKPIVNEVRSDMLVRYLADAEQQEHKSPAFLLGGQKKDDTARFLYLTCDSINVDDDNAVEQLRKLIPIALDKYIFVLQSRMKMEQLFDVYYSKAPSPKIEPKNGTTHVASGEFEAAKSLSRKGGGR